MARRVYGTYSIKISPIFLTNLKLTAKFFWQTLRAIMVRNSYIVANWELEESNVRKSLVWRALQVVGLKLARLTMNYCFRQAIQCFFCRNSQRTARSMNMRNGQPLVLPAKAKNWTILFYSIKTSRENMFWYWYGWIPDFGHIKFFLAWVSLQEETKNNRKGTCRDQWPAWWSSTQTCQRAPASRRHIGSLRMRCPP